MKVGDILTLVSDELRDSRETKYSKTSMLLKLKEAATQFVQDSMILKNSVEIRPVAGQSVYPLPVFGINFEDFTGVGFAASVTNSQVVPTYLSSIRIGWTGLSSTSGENKVLQPNSRFEMDEGGSSFYAQGTPLYLYNDDLNFNQLGVWPTPDATAIDTGGEDNRIQLDYVRDVLYYTDAAGTTLSADQEAITENDYLDPQIPIQQQRKLYLLVCYLRLKNAVDPIDVQKAANFKAMYEEELLKQALESGNHMDRYNQIKVSS